MAAIVIEARFRKSFQTNSQMKLWVVVLAVQARSTHSFFLTPLAGRPAACYAPGRPATCCASLPANYNKGPNCGHPRVTSIASIATNETPEELSPALVLAASFVLSVVCGSFYVWSM